MKRLIKYLTINVLIFTVPCFAISQKVVDGLKEYEIAVEKLKKTASELKSNNMLDGWDLKDLVRGDFLCRDGIAECFADYIDEAKYGAMAVKYNEAKKLVNKLKPKRDEYNRQKAKEERIKDTIDSIITGATITGVFLSFFGFIIWLGITQQKKYKKLLEEGKITQEEYDRIMQYHKPESTFNSNLGVNPSTGLPMTGLGISDVGGNVRGSSSISSSYDYSQNYSSSHRWD